MTSPTYLPRPPAMITSRRPANAAGELTVNGRPQRGTGAAEPPQAPTAGDLIAAGRS
jgi:hypothetical protein